MTRLAMAVGLGAGLLLLVGQADAQWRYTDDKGVTRVTQYKIDVPAPQRDAAEWIGPVGIGKPALSEEQLRAARHWEAVQRLIAAETALMQIKPVPTPAPLRVDSSAGGRPMPSMCIAGELRVMTSPGIWKIVGGCPTGPSGFSSGYGSDGYGSFGGITVR
jgi:hypothetical protein